MKFFPHQELTKSIIGVYYDVYNELGYGFLEKVYHVITTLLFFVLLIISFVLLFVPLIISQGENLSLLDINSLEIGFNDMVSSISNYLETYHVNFKQLIDSSNLTSKINFNFIPDIFNGIINIVGNLGMGLASVLFISFFLLKEKEQAFKIFKFILPRNHKTKILVSIDKIQHLLSRYFIGLLLQLFIILILYLIVFLIFGVDNAFIIALLCAVLNIIPYLGPLLGMIVATLLIMISGIGDDFIQSTLPNTIYVICGMFIVQLIDNNLSQPIIFSKSTKSHPLEIFLVILCAGILFGITGMIIAVPSYTALKVIGKEFLPENKIIKALTKDL
ncbi:AI-2E family transporter [Flavobacterium sp. 9AF]|uniref:AI-2E family transporter n=1 Tax=Flavobacterium sp. 9AF TaxID=2653142 RepID=UPI0012F04CED|nr:AI-2E family transporter [Flavobacterium sp. 9AF]VXB55326.1 AI-2E family transporter [Flavobacterium sp. 9AF]